MREVEATMGSRHNSGPLNGPGQGRRMPKRRHRLKGSYFEQYNTSIIAAFKSVPSFRPDQFKVHRPMMGQCCSCLPSSRRDLISERICEEGIRNIFDVRTELGSCGYFARSMPSIAYALRRVGQGKFPDVSLAVLNNKRVVEAVQLTLQEAQAEHADSPSSKKRPPPSLSNYQQSAKRILSKMKASISGHLVRLTGWFLLKFLSQFLRTIQVHKGQLEMVHKVAQRGVPVIYVPLHRSHLDYILVTFILWNYSIRAPYVAAGNNLDIPFFNMLMRGLGGFYIRRKLDKGGKKDHIYRAVLHTYMQELLKKGEAFEFFIEGGRTRSGKALTPKGGLLSIVVDSCIEGLIPDAYVVPISISYERLLDGNFHREQMGLPKVSESFLGAWKGIWRVLCQNFGSVRIDFAQPFSVKEYIQCNPSQLNRPLSPMASSSGENSPESSCPSLNGMTSSSSRASLQFDCLDNSRCLVKGMGLHIVHTAVHSTALTCTNMVAFLFLIKFRQGVTMPRLVHSFNWLKQELKMRNRDVAFCGESDVVVEYAEALLGTDLITRKHDENDVEVLIPCLTLPNVFELTYYGNNVISPFLLESVIANALMYVGKFSPTNTPLQENGPVRVCRERVIGVAEELCKLLQEEFIFVPPCGRLNEALSDMVEQFISLEILAEEESEYDNLYTTFDRQWANRLSAQLSWADEEDDDTDDTFVEEKPLKLNIEQHTVCDKLQFYHRILAPILETYLVTAYRISGSLGTEMPEDDFMRMLLAHAQDRVAKNSSLYAESASMDTLKNAVKAYQNIRIVECYNASNLRIIGLCDHYQVKERLGHYIELLETLRE
ncbi:glycerol-3-phosphate acyltransferase 1, mitochondrial-like isoform X1 [Haliotis cracherodii]|uniref:glycerol-3-phosphate acyltransferase 1, mitochondrial-like isoform X1 n=2 Tax=Haliotis cracherodii TaxID=6455 RepID=UPI0039EBAD5C